MEQTPKRRAITEILEKASETLNQPAYHDRTAILLQVAQIQAQLMIIDSLDKLRLELQAREPIKPKPVTHETYRNGHDSH